MQCYLKDRMQIVKVSDVNSDERNVTIAVPQRSILCPLLFVIYVHNRLTVINKESIVQIQVTLSFLVLIKHGT